VFGAFANAAGMVAPVLAWRDRLEAGLGAWSGPLVTAGLYFVALVLLPLLSVAGAAALSRRWGRLSGGGLSVAARDCVALGPMGFGMWLAHYSFHFLTSYDAAAPTTQRFAAEHGWTFLGEPVWRGSCCAPVVSWLPRLEVLFLQFGLLLSLYAGWRISLAR